MFFAYFGFFVFIYLIVKYAIKIYNNIGTFYFGLGAVDFKKYGTWSVITGCTDGIGKAYAEQLAMKGQNVVLISRSLDKLQKLEKELREKFHVETLIISADFTEQDSIYPSIREKLANLDIGILVNNVGMGIGGRNYFHVIAESDAKFSSIINCNITSMVKMTAIVLPNMVKKSKGIIINNGSGTGRIPIPFVATYSSTKAFVDFFSRALAIEYGSKGILVQSLCPHYVSTKLSEKKVSFTAPDPTSYVKDALNTIASQPVTNGCLTHNVQGWLMEEVMPEFLLKKILSMIIGPKKENKTN